MFSGHGQVASASVARDRGTQRLKGFAFVKMHANEEAQAAGTTINGKEIQQGTLTVNEARPREELSFGGAGNNNGNRSTDNRSIEPKTYKNGRAKRVLR